MRFSCLLLLACLTGCAGRELSTNQYEAVSDSRAAALIERGTTESLATASVMLGFRQNSEALALINRGAAREATRIVETIGALRGLDIYWNKTVVMMVDALGEITLRDAHAPQPTLSERMVTTIGLLAAMSIPPLQPFSKACRQTQFDQPGRRSACEAMALRLRQSDTMIIQSLGLTVQTRWSAEGSPERENLMAQKRQFYYLLDASSRERRFHSNADFATRLEAMRHSTSEAEVAQAMLISFHEPLERPLNWKEPFPRFE